MKQIPDYAAHHPPDRKAPDHFVQTVVHGIVSQQGVTGTRFEDAYPPEEAEASLTEVATELAPTAAADMQSAFVLGTLSSCVCPGQFTKVG